jgi:hypothetical protein
MCSRFRRARSIAEHLFKEWLWIHEETFDQAPILLAEAIKNLILRYHRVVV